MTFRHPFWVHHKVILARLPQFHDHLNQPFSTLEKTFQSYANNYLIHQYDGQWEECPIHLWTLGRITPYRQLKRSMASVGTYPRGRSCSLLKEPLVISGGILGFNGALVEKPWSKQMYEFRAISQHQQSLLYLVPDLKKNYKVSFIYVPYLSACNTREKEGNFRKKTFFK